MEDSYLITPFDKAKMVKLSEWKQLYFYLCIELCVLYFFLLLCIVKKILLNTQNVKQVHIVGWLNAYENQVLTQVALHSQTKDNFDKDLMKEEAQIPLKIHLYRTLLEQKLWSYKGFDEVLNYVPHWRVHSEASIASQYWRYIYSVAIFRTSCCHLQHFEVQKM